jgi:hypothetical protein
MDLARRMAEQPFPIGGIVALTGVVIVNGLGRKKEVEYEVSAKRKLKKHA